MMPTILSEWRKIISIRSTYVILTISALLTTFLAFFLDGYKGGIINEAHIADIGTAISNIAGLCALLLAIIVALHVAHEYRYNTIMYSLTATNSRLKFLAAKALVATIVVVVAASLLTLLGVVAARIGLAMNGSVSGYANLDLWSVSWRTLFYYAGFSAIAFLLTLVARNIIVPMIALFFVPGAIEALIGMAIKGSARFLPFNLLGNVINPEGTGMTLDKWSAGTAALIFSGYIVVAGIAVTLWFRYRDAN